MDELIEKSAGVGVAMEMCINANLICLLNIKRVNNRWRND